MIFEERVKTFFFFKAFLIGLVVSCCRGKKSVIEGEVEADDSDISDDEYVHWKKT